MRKLQRVEEQRVDRVKEIQRLHVKLNVIMLMNYFECY